MRRFGVGAEAVSNLVVKPHEKNERLLSLRRVMIITNFQGNRAARLP